jgi:hypothetical protein
VTNKSSGKDELFVSVDYSASATDGKLSSLCEKHNVTVPNEQVMREWFLAKEKSAILELQQRRIETASQASQVVGPPPLPPFASITRSLPVTVSVNLVIALLITTFFVLQRLIKKDKKKF